MAQTEWKEEADENVRREMAKDL